MRKKVIIIGSSVAGCSAANLLAEDCEVIVYEQKAREDVGKKLCADIVTPSFLKYAGILGINPDKCIISKFKKAIAVSENQIAEFKTDEFKISRIKLIEELINKAERKGAKFEFKSPFKDFKEEKGGFIVYLKDEINNCDILIGADGAVSNVARKAGLWKNRKLMLAIQSNVQSKKLDIDKDTYYVYLGKEKFGYYSYIFPSKNEAVVGMEDRPKNVREKYDNFIKILNIDKIKKDAALIPEPQIIPQKKNLFVIGDAGCHIKFSSGGIIPSMMAAEAVSDIIIKKDYGKLKKLNRRTFMNRLATKLFWNLSDKEFDHFLSVLKDRKFYELLEKRDEYSGKDYMSFMDLRLFRYLFKIF